MIFNQLTFVSGAFWVNLDAREGKRFKVQAVKEKHRWFMSPPLSALQLKEAFLKKKLNSNTVINVKNIQNAFVRSLAGGFVKHYSSEEGSFLRIMQQPLFAQPCTVLPSLGVSSSLMLLEPLLLMCMVICSTSLSIFTPQERCETLSFFSNFKRLFLLVKHMKNICTQTRTDCSKAQANY